MVAKPHHVTPAEYIAMDEASVEKHEYHRGYVYAMSGASGAHNMICGNLIGALTAQLRGRRCAVMPADQRVYIEQSDLAVYPDVTVLCETARFHPQFRHSLENPSIVVEVLSPSTEIYDRGDKFDHYGRLASLKEYVLVSTSRMAVDHYLREQDGTWRLTKARGRVGSVRFPSVDAEVALAVLYANLDIVVPGGIPEVDSPAPPPVQDARTRPRS